MRRLWILAALVAAGILAAPTTVWGGTGHHRAKGAHRPHQHRPHKHRHRRRHKPSAHAPARSSPSTGAGSIGGGTQGTSTSGRKIQHVVWIWMENWSYSDIIGNTSSAPYINHTLVPSYGLATNYAATDHGSLPNYLKATTGDPNVGGSDDSDTFSLDATKDPSIFSQLPSGQSRSLEQSMNTNCQSGNNGSYYGHHNPMGYMNNIGGGVNAPSGDCANYDVPLGTTPDLSARFTFITPSITNDMHSPSGAQSAIRTGDSWLSSFIPQLQATPQYQAGTTAIFIVWDEDSSTWGAPVAFTPDGRPNHVACLVISPHTHDVRDATSYTHYSLLRTAEELLGLPLLGNAASANSMVSGFGL